MGPDAQGRRGGGVSRGNTPAKDTAGEEGQRLRMAWGLDARKEGISSKSDSSAQCLPVGAT